MKRKAHRNELKPIITGAICTLFLALMIANGIVGAFFGKVVVQ